MTLFTIVKAYLRAKMSNTILHIILMSLGVALMTSLLLFGHQMKERLYKDGAGIDLVVGAKGSPLQLILSSIQHMDIPTGNIKLSDAMRIKKHPHIKQAIPISLGDTYKSFRIVGTEDSYLTHFKAEFKEGQVWQKSMQAVIGSRVAQATGLKPGSNFTGSHGIIPGGRGHSDHPYNIVGILKPTGTVLDRLIVTSLDSVWDVHDESHAHHDEHEEEEHHQEDETVIIEEKKEITALLISYRNRLATMSFPRMINGQTSMQAASPAFEMARLFDLIGVGTDTAFIFSAFLVTVALVSVLIGLLNSIRDRRYDLAVFRSLGASRRKILSIVIMEGMTITIIGSICGILLGHGFIEIIGSYTDKGAEIGLTGFIFLGQIWIILFVLLLLSFIACLIPAWEAYKTDIQKTLINV